jgi:7-keto-8-aminopelargonate synthetase-like enzyme
MTEPEPLQQLDRTYVRAGNRKLSYFSGCDYFRLASHPEVLKEAAKGMREVGLNVAASRLTTGNHLIYERLERELASFFAAESALLVSSGYTAGIMTGQALAGQFSHILMDARAHPALEDAARFLDCPVLRFKHRSAADLEKQASRCGRGARLILLTDGMFSHDGSAAPLKEYEQVLPSDAWMLVDDAHGAGVLGKTGKGTLEHAGVGRRRVIQTVTLSKAFGAYGGAILTNPAVRKGILETSHAFVGSTPVPLPLAQAARAALSLLRRDRSLRIRLKENTAWVKNRLRHAGLDVPDLPGPIIALHPDSTAARKLNQRLLKSGIFPPFIRYPGGPAEGYFRFVISSEHSPGQLEQLVRALSETAL